jgi:O-Antigen ligase
VTTVLVAVLALALFLPATRQLVQEGYNRTIARESADDEYLDLERILMFQQGWESFTQHPLLGIGYDNLGERVADTYGYEVVSHNILITLITESGWPGFILFVLLIREFLRRTGRAETCDEQRTKGFYTACKFSMIVALLSGMAYPLLQFPLFYFLLGLGYAATGKQRDPAQLAVSPLPRPAMGPA